MLLFASGVSHLFKCIWNIMQFFSILYDDSCCIW